MNFGGPVWHASCAGHEPTWKLKALAEAALAGVGDKSKQWEEWTGKAFHLRRRLTEAEQATIGEAVDLRGTEEGRQRYVAAKSRLCEAGRRYAKEEMGI